MGFTKEQLLARLKELQIDFAQYEHPPVLTVQAQAEYVGDKGGGLSKNLFLKDKKSRFYIVSALADTKVDLKVLSQRLGLGKGGVRMAPEEALSKILQVPLGCVTPFAVINDSARHVSLLLDKEFKTKGRCLFHPLSNDISIALSSQELDKFLTSIGRDPVYVDLEDNPQVGRDQPPDLAAFVPSDSVVLPGASETAESLKEPTENPVPIEKKSAAAPAKAKNPPSKLKDSKDKSSVNGCKPSAVSDAGLFVEEILSKMSALLLSETSKLTNGEHLGTEVAEGVRKRLAPDLTILAAMFKNNAYTQGFQAGIHHQSRHR